MLSLYRPIKNNAVKPKMFAQVPNFRYLLYKSCQTYRYLSGAITKKHIWNTLKINFNAQDKKWRNFRMLKNYTDTNISIYQLNIYNKKEHQILAADMNF
jgi:hypothetical protein